MPRGQYGLAYSHHMALCLHAIANQLRHGEHFHVVDFAELSEIMHAGHGAVFIHDLADYAGGNHSSHAGQIDRSFSLSGADQHAAFAGAEREDMAGTDKIRSSACRINGYLDRSCPIMRGNSCGDAFTRLNALIKSSPVRRGIFARHWAN